jgi:hypothetical protein
MGKFNSKVEPSPGTDCVPSARFHCKWLAGGEEENLQIMTDEEIINNVLDDDNSENEQESSTPPIIRTIRRDGAMSASNTCSEWAEENNVPAEDILALKQF